MVMFCAMYLVAPGSCSPYSYLLPAGQLCGRIAVGDGEISFSVQTGPGTDPAAPTVSEGAFTLGVKHPGCGTDFSSPCRADVMHEYSCTAEQLLC